MSAVVPDIVPTGDNIWTWVGGTVIFASAVYIAFREAKVKASRSAAGDEDG